MRASVKEAASYVPVLRNARQAAEQAIQSVKADRTSTWESISDRRLVAEYGKLGPRKRPARAA